MPTEGTPRSSYRLRPDTLDRIRQIAEARGGLTATRVVELAVEELHRRTCGRRPADHRPVRVRK